MKHLGLSLLMAGVRKQEPFELEIDTEKRCKKCKLKGIFKDSELCPACAMKSKP